MGQIILEEKNFSINSDGWKENTFIENERLYDINLPNEFPIKRVELINPEGDIWEFQGNQYFTFESGKRELERAGKKCPTTNEWKELVNEDSKNLPPFLGMRCEKNGNLEYFDLERHGHYLASDNELKCIMIPVVINQGDNKDSEVKGDNKDSEIVGYSICCIKN